MCTQPCSSKRLLLGFCLAAMGSGCLIAAVAASRIPKVKELKARQLQAFRAATGVVGGTLLLASFGAGVRVTKTRIDPEQSQSPSESQTQESEEPSDTDASSEPKAFNMSPKARQAQFLGAVAKRDFDRADELLEAGVTDVDAPIDEAMGPALGIALYAGDVQLAEKLLERGASVTSCVCGTPLVHWALRSGREAAAALLLRYGADPKCYLESVSIDVEKPGGKDWLREQFSDTAVVSQLEEAWDALYRSTDEQRNMSPEDRQENFCRALRSGAFFEAYQLLNAGVIDLNAPIGEGLPPALWIACYAGETELVQALINEGADANAPFNGGSLLSWAMADTGRHPLAALLLQSGADPKCYLRSLPPLVRRVKGRAYIREICKDTMIVDALEKAWDELVAEAKQRRQRST